MSQPFDRRSFHARPRPPRVGAATLPMTLVELAFAKPARQLHVRATSRTRTSSTIKGTQFVRNWDRGLIRAVAETNLLTPQPDFVLFGGDLAQLGHQGRARPRRRAALEAQAARSTT